MLMWCSPQSTASCVQLEIFWYHKAPAYPGFCIRSVFTLVILCLKVKTEATWCEELIYEGKGASVTFLFPGPDLLQLQAKNSKNKLSCGNLD